MPDGAEAAPAAQQADYGTQQTVATEPYEAGDTVTDARGVWTFQGWATENATVEGGQFTMPANNVAFTGTWTLTDPAAYEVTYAYAGGVPDGADQTWTPVVTDSEGNVIDPSNYDVTYSTDDRTNVTGVITVTITGKVNYGGTVTREYQITPLPITIQIDAISKYEGEADPTYTSHYVTDQNRTQIVQGEVPAWQGGFVRDVGEAVGVYNMYQGDYALADNAETGFIAANYYLTVLPGTLTITAAPVTPPGGGDNPGGGTPDGTTPGGGTPGGTATPTAVTEDGAAIEDDATPLAVTGETIDDEGTPLTSGAKAHVDCWVHWLMIIGLIVSAIYFGGVAIRRRTFSSQLQSFEDDVLGNNANNTTNA